MRRTHDLYDAEQFAVHTDFVFVADADVVEIKFATPPTRRAVAKMPDHCIETLNRFILIPYPSRKLGRLIFKATAARRLVGFRIILHRHHYQSYSFWTMDYVPTFCTTGTGNLPAWTFSSPPYMRSTR